MSTKLHERIEAIAGAIALGEASDDERREYREHIAVCEPCLRAFGGEREIERVASTIDRARESEVWDPSIGDVVATRRTRRVRAVRWGLATAGVALAASIAAQALGPGSALHASKQTIPLPAVELAAAHVPAQPTQPPAHKAIAPAAPRLIVTHNVVQIARAPISIPVPQPLAEQKTDSKPRQLVTITVHPDVSQQQQQSAQSNIPVWRRGDTAWRTVAKTTTTSVTETAPQTLTHNAEAIELAANYTRDVSPVGGETAINPQPPMIAYSEGAEGTTAFEVRVDERGTPVRCLITKPSGYAVLDDTVCKAAMKVRYIPRMVDGRTVPGVYRDAFTFHMSDDTSSIEGLPAQQIPPAGPVPQRRGVPSNNRSSRGRN